MIKYAIHLVAGVLMLFCLNQTRAQKYFTRDGHISFFSETPIENIEAHNQKATAVLDAESGRIEFAVLIKAFHFEKALMEEHFNENYMESNTYPKAVFRGQIENASDVNLNVDGTYPVSINGEMTIHGVTNPLQANGKFEVEGNAIRGTSSFDIAVADYNIEIPKIVRDNIARIIRVDVDINLQELKK